MEQALRYELIKAIPELNDSIYPTNAPEGAVKPYLVYARITTRNIKTLDGYTHKQALSYMFSVMASEYGSMKSLAKKVENLLIGMAQRTIGADDIYIEDLEINNISETYEFDLKVNRGIIDFTIYY